MEHTQGPWEAGSIGTIEGIPAQEIMSGDDTLGYCFNYTEGDARLIAAAPDMLGALRIAEQQINDNYGHESWARGTLAVIRSAIAKATTV